MRCYEYLGCKQTECAMYGKVDGPQCWEVNGTLCYHHVIEELRHELSDEKKKESCKACNCLYYNEANYD